MINSRIRLPFSIFFLNPVYVAACSLRSLRSNDKSERNYRGKCLGWPVTSYGSGVIFIPPENFVLKINALKKEQQRKLNHSLGTECLCQNFYLTNKIRWWQHAGLTWKTIQRHKGPSLLDVFQLQRQQDAIATFFPFSLLFCQCSFVFRCTCWIRFQLVFKIVKCHSCPEHLETCYIATRASSRSRPLREDSLLNIPTAISTMGQKTSQYFASKDWNRLPKELRDMTNLKSFKTELLKYLFNAHKASHQCTVINLLIFYTYRSSMPYCFYFMPFYCRYSYGIFLYHLLHFISYLMLHMY